MIDLILKLSKKVRFKEKSERDTREASESNLRTVQEDSSNIFRGSFTQENEEINPDILFQSANTAGADSAESSDAQKGLVFFEGFREEILAELRKPVPKTSSAPSGQMLTNLLRSEHIPYNIFFPMNKDLNGCKDLFNHILGKEEILRIYHWESLSLMPQRLQVSKISMRR